MIMKHVFISLLLILAFPIGAMEHLSKAQSFIESKHLTLGVGLGTSSFTLQENVDASYGFAFRVSAGHHFKSYLHGEMVYQFSTLRMNSPDPVLLGQFINTRVMMNQEYFRLLFLYPKFQIQPYLALGVGGYGIGADTKSALSFPIDWMIPLAAGLRWYYLKNKFSLDVEYAHFILFGENQDANTLGLIAKDEVGFDTQSLMATFVFHLF